MEYLDYLKTILNDEELNQLEEAYNKEGLNGLRVNLLNASTFNDHLFQLLAGT